MAPRVEAAYVIAVLNNNGAFGQCGSVNPIDPGEPCAGAPNLGSVSVSGAGGATDGNGAALTEYGVNKVRASSGVTGGMIAASEWQVQYSLSGAPVGTPVQLLLTLGYDVTIGASSGSADFQITVNNDVFSRYIISTTTNPFGGDSCFDRPGPTAIGQCAGNHNGTINRIIQATVGPNNRLNISVQARSFGLAAVDAYHTLSVLRILVPDGISWQYGGLAGNPLNFEYEASPTAVPEPGGMALLGLGLVAAGVNRRWRRG